MSTIGPPGWEPHKITTRIDGWVVDPAFPFTIPEAAAKLIVDALPPLNGHDTIDTIRARMLARQAMHDAEHQIIFGRHDD